MITIKLPTVAGISYDFKSMEIRGYKPENGLDITPFTSPDGQFLLILFFKNPEGRKEFLRYRQDCINQGKSVDFLEPYQAIFDEYAQDSA